MPADNLPAGKRSREEVPGGGAKGAAAKKLATGKPNGSAPPVNASSGLTTNDALGYLREVKRRFADKKDVYDQFLEIMKHFKAGRLNTPGVVEKVKTLFKGDRDLILGFNTFLPKGYEITLTAEEEKPAVEFDQAISYVNKIKSRFSSDERVYRAFLEILNLYRKSQKTISQVYDEVALLFRGHQDLLDEFAFFLPDNRNSVQGGRSNKLTLGRSAPVSRPAVKGRNRPQQKGAKPALQKKKPEVSVKAEEKKAAPKEPLVTPVFESSQQYLELVKSRLQDRSAYLEFLKLLQMFGQEIVTMPELKGMVRDVLKKHPDLMAGFSKFLKLSTSEMENVEVPTGKMTAKESAKARQQAANQMTKFMTRPICELDLSDCKHCGPSYRLLPSNYPKTSTTRRNELGRQLFNDDWVGVTSGSEDYSFKHMRKNQYEENLFRVEDDKYELDILMECNRSAIRKLKPIADRLEVMRPDEKAALRLTSKDLRPMQARVIEKIYAEQGPTLVKLLRQNPAVALPLVITRLEQKDAEWTKTKADMRRTWQEIFDRNYHKSLDHRSFYFKQTDKRQLGYKTMLAEAREAAEKRRATQGNRYILTSACAADGMQERLRTTNTTDLEFDFSDAKVHEDVYKVVLAAVEEMLGNKQARKVMEIWVEFVEAFLGLPTRKLPSFDDEDKDEAPKASGNKARHQEEDEDSADDDERAKSSSKGAVTGDEDEDVGDSDSEHGGKFVSCRPLAAAVSSSCQTKPGKEAGQQNSASNTRQQEGGRRGGVIFYANDNIYVVIRLHSFLYARLRTARKCATEQAASDKSGRMTAEQIHEDFMKMVMDVIDGTVEPGQYEDDCRALMGTNSYELFTLDKLIYKLIKQLQVLLADELGGNLIELWSYEGRRHEYPLAARDTLYYVNSHVLMHDDICYRLTFESSESKVLVTSLEPNRVEVAPGIVGAGFSSYLQSYIGSSAGEDEDRSVFLKRTLPSRLRTFSATSFTPESELMLQDIIQDAQLINGLKCKVSCSNSKVSYVTETEDSFASAAMKCSPAQRQQLSKSVAAEFQQRAGKFQAWGEVQRVKVAQLAEEVAKRKAANKKVAEEEEEEEYEEEEEEECEGGGGLKEEEERWEDRHGLLAAAGDELEHEDQEMADAAEAEEDDEAAPIDKDDDME